MTCIVGLVDQGNVWIGGDSAGVGGYDLMLRADQKVFRNGDFLMGFTSSFRMGQLLRYKLSPPKLHSDDDIYQYMVAHFAESVRTCLKDGGFTRNDKGEESGGTFLVGVKGRLFCVEGDFQVGEPQDPFWAVGCGANFALGVLYATSGMLPRERVEMALRAAEQYSAGVRGPFHIECLEGS
jgi:ATP-dependent protease HslVU (ClpYQ) peptidase subunit